MIDNKPTKLVLVLGGSTFMGKTLLTKLREIPQYRVLFINRGRKYWNGESKQYMNNDYYYGNRQDHTDFTRLLKYINIKHGITPDNKWAAIVDFSAFSHPDIDSVQEAVRGLTDLYVFISSDSMYDAMGIKYSDQALRETPCVELEGQAKEEAKDKEEYGYNKLKCELLLQKHRSEQFPYVSLILPDVIGPYDDTGRYWGCLKWLQRCTVDPIHIDEESETRRSSLVFSLDVVGLICHLIQLPQKKQVIGRSYHLAFDERPTLLELLNDMADSLQVKPNYQKVKSASCFYPSVDFGSLDTTLAKKLLGWQPTPLKEAIVTTTAFFVEKGPKYQEQDEYAQRKLRKKLKP